MDSIHEITEEEYVNYFFIGVVKKYPALYAKSDKAYQNAGKKENLWMAVSNEVKIPIDEAKKKWKNLRDRYLKELRKVEQTATSGAGSSQVHQPKWCLYNELSFLSSHCKRRSTTSNYRVDPQPTEGDSEPDTQEQNMTAPEYIDVEELMDVENSTPTMVSSTPAKRKKRSDALDEKIHGILNIVGDVATSMQVDQTNRHKDFCNYLGQRMSSLPMKVARELEVEFTARVNEVLDVYSNE